MWQNQKNFIAYNSERLGTTMLQLPPLCFCCRCPMGPPVRNHCWRPPQGDKVSDASHLCKSHTRGQTGNQTHLRVSCVQNQNEGPWLRLDLQVEEQREDSPMDARRCGSAARVIKPWCRDAHSSSLHRNTVRICHCHRCYAWSFILPRGIWYILA